MVHDLEHRMDCIEYDEWKEFWTLEPWGTEVEDDRIAKTINYQIAMNTSEDHKWIPTKKLFPRTQSDIDALSSKSEPEGDDLDVGVRLRDMFRARNERLAQNGQQGHPQA